MAEDTYFCVVPVPHSAERKSCDRAELERLLIHMGVNPKHVVVTANYLENRIEQEARKLADKLVPQYMKKDSHDGF